MKLKFKTLDSKFQILPWLLSALFLAPMGVCHGGDLGEAVSPLIIEPIENPLEVSLEPVQEPQGIKSWNRKNLRPSKQVILSHIQIKKEGYRESILKKKKDVRKEYLHGKRKALHPSETIECVLKIQILEKISEALEKASLEQMDSYLEAQNMGHLSEFIDTLDQRTLGTLQDFLHTFVKSVF